MGKNYSSKPAVLMQLMENIKENQNLLKCNLVYLSTLDALPTYLMAFLIYLMYYTVHFRDLLSFFTFR